MTEAVARRCSVKKVFLEISQNSQKNTCARVSFLISCRPEACNFIWKRLWHRCFPVNFTKFLRTPFLQNTSGRLILQSLIFYKVAAGACNFTKIRLWHKCFPAELAKFLKTPFLQNTSSGCFCTARNFTEKWSPS